MKKIVTILIILILNISSCQKKEDIFDENAIEFLSEGNYKSTSIYGYISLFVLTDNNEIIETNSAYLRYVFEHYYTKSFANFNSFLIAVLNKKIQIPKINFKKIPHTTFQIDKSIETKYNNSNFDSFFNKFVEQKKLKVLNLNENEIRSVSYFLYINGYHVKIDDARGEYNVIERKNIFK